MPTSRSQERRFEAQWLPPSRIYYAHCIGLYDTAQEERDLTTIRKIFGGKAVVINPNCAATLREVYKAKAAGHEVMTTVFRPLVDACQVLVFRAAAGGRIPSGLSRELEWATELGKVILELPTAIIGRRMGLIETRAYLEESGQR